MVADVTGGVDGLQGEVLDREGVTVIDVADKVLRGSKGRRKLREHLEDLVFESVVVEHLVDFWFLFLTFEELKDIPKTSKVIMVSMCYQYFRDICL